MVPANRGILVKLDGVRFLFSVRVIEKAQKKGKVFIVKSVFFEVFNLIFFTAERLACFEMQPRQRRFEEF